MTSNKNSPLQLSEDLTTTLNKISRGRGISPSFNFIQSATKAGAQCENDIEIIKLERGQRFVSAKVKGKRKKIEILTEEELVIATSKNMLPPDKWFEEINSKLKLRRKLKKNVEEAKRRQVSNIEINIDDFD